MLKNSWKYNFFMFSKKNSSILKYSSKYHYFTFIKKIMKIQLLYIHPKSSWTYKYFEFVKKKIDEDIIIYFTIIKRFLSN